MALNPEIVVSTDSPWYQIKQIRFTKVDFDKVSLGPFSHIGEEILHWQYPLILRSPLHLLIHEIHVPYEISHLSM